MRLKSIKLEKRNKEYNDSKKKVLNSLTDNINDLGNIFDAMVQLENFIIGNISEEVSELISIRAKREEIETQKGFDIYIAKYFLPQAKKISSKIEMLKKSWDDNNNSKDYKIKDLEEYTHNLKKLSKSLIEVGKSGIGAETVGAINDLINEFGKLKVIKAIFTTNIIDKINIIIQLNYEIDVNKIENIDKLKELTIDDL